MPETRNAIEQTPASSQSNQSTGHQTQNEEVDEERTDTPEHTAPDENLSAVSSYENMNGIVFNPRSGGTAKCSQFPHG